MTNNSLITPYDQKTNLKRKKRKANEVLPLRVLRPDVVWQVLAEKHLMVEEGRRAAPTNNAMTPKQTPKKHLPKASPKEQRMYEHIKESAKQSGRYKGREKEVAARTVRKKQKQS